MENEADKNSLKVTLYCLNNIYLLSSQALMRENLLARMAETNELLSLIKPEDLSPFKSLEILALYRRSLRQTEPTEFALAISFFRILLAADPSVSQKYLKIHIHILLSNVLAKDYQLALDCLLLLKDWIVYSNQNLAQLNGFSIKSLAALEPASAENSGALRAAKSLAVEVLLLLAARNLKMFLRLGCLNVLVRRVLDTSIEDSLRKTCSMSLVDYLFDEPDARKSLINNFDLGPVFACFTGAGIQRDDLPQRLNIASSFLFETLCSPVGLLFFRKNYSYFEYLVEALRHPVGDLAVKENILLLFKQVLKTSDRKPLFMQVLLMQLLISCNLYNVLVELSMLHEFEKPAKKLLIAFAKASSRTVAFAQMPSNDFLAYSMKVTEAEELSEENNIFVSQIKSIFDKRAQVVNALENKGETADRSRSNAIFYTCENLFLEINSTFKDNRISKNYFWSPLAKEVTAGKLDFDGLKKTLADSVENWNSGQLANFLAFIAENNEVVLDEEVSDIIGRFLNYIFSGFLWCKNHSEETFPLLKLAIQFVHIVLSNGHTADMFIEFTLANKFFRKFIGALKTNIGSNVFMHNNVHLNEKNRTNSYSKRTRSVLRQERNFNPASKNLRAQEISSRLAEKNPSLKSTPEFAIEENFFRFYRSLFSFAGQLTFHSRGHDLLRKENFYNDVARLVKVTEDFDQYIPLFLLNCNYRRFNCRAILMEALTHGSVFLAKVCVNVLDFLTESDWIELFIEHIDSLIFKFKSHDCDEGLHKLIVRLLVKLIEQTSLDQKILEFLGFEVLKVDLPLFCALSKKEEFLSRAVQEEGYINGVFEAFINSGDLQAIAARMNKSRSPESSDHRHFSEQYVYPHSWNLASNSFEDSGFYKAALMQFDWGVQTKIAFQGCIEPLFLTTKISFDSTLNSLSLEALVDFQACSNELLSGLATDDFKWQVSSALLLYGKTLSPSFDVLQEDFPQLFNAVSFQDLQMTSEREFFADKNGVFYFFRKNKDGKLNLRKITLNVFLHRKTAFDSSSFGLKCKENFLSAMSATKIGAQTLHDKGIIRHLIDKALNEPNLQLQKGFQLALGLIGANIEGARILGLADYEPSLRRLFEEQPSERLLLSYKANIYHLANLLCMNEEGRKILQQDSVGPNEWRILYISNKGLNEADHRFIAVMNEKPDSFQEKQTLLANLKKPLSDKIKEITVKYSDSVKEKTFMASVIEAIKGKGSGKIQPADVNFNPDMFYYVLYLLTFFDLSNVNARQLLWQLIDKFLMEKSFLSLLDSQSQKSNNASDLS